MQKLIEHCNEEQRVAIISKAANDLVAIALNMHGTRAVQKIVETVTSAKEVEVVVQALRSSVVTLIKDLNGNHVIQRCLHHLSSNDNQFIFDAVARHCVSVSTHKHGCCVLQRCLDYSSALQKRQIVQEVVNNALELVQDAFGNYVVQYVLDLGEAQVSAGIITNLLGHISALSVQKFSSNVVEKGLELASDKLRARMIEELMNAERLPRLLQDPYANYVLQKALTVCKKQQFDRLVAAIKPSSADAEEHELWQENPIEDRQEVPSPRATDGRGGRNAGNAGGSGWAAVHAATAAVAWSDAEWRRWKGYSRVWRVEPHQRSAAFPVASSAPPTAAALGTAAPESRPSTGGAEWEPRLQ